MTDPKPKLPAIPRHYQPPKAGERRPNISRERVRQIETMALRKLRRELILRGIKVDDLLPD